MGFLKFLGKRKRTVSMECPYCNGKMLPIEQFEWFHILIMQKFSKYLHYFFGFKNALSLYTKKEG